MFGLDPFSRPVAIAEMLLLLTFASFVGILLGRLVLNSRINTLRADIGNKEAELDECRRPKTAPSGMTVTPAHNILIAPEIAVSRPEPVIETSVAYVSADPLLPAYSHDDTPAPVAVAAGAPLVNLSGYNDELADEPVILSPVSVFPVTSGIPMSGNSEAAVLNRITARVNEINFDRIGRATAAEADDLKDIIGVGPFLERKLHSLGIYTFRQIANFTKEDAANVNSVIEFFPGRIEHDNWVNQSKIFHERKYGQRI